jgi:hypothetical protein
VPRQKEELTDYGITGIFLPTGEVIEMPSIRSFNYNANINALRFSFNVKKFVPLSVDQLTGRVKNIHEEDGRCVVVAHRFFRHLDSLYIQDADVKIIQT